MSSDTATAALASYPARGMSVSREEMQLKEVADAPPGPWPGAQVRPLG